MRVAVNIVKYNQKEEVMLKDLLTSKTVWGVVAMIGAMVAKKYGYELDAEGLTTELISMAGGALAIYGRVVASGPIAAK